MNPDRIKSIRRHMLFASILLLIAGIVFIVWPDAAAIILTRVVAAAILAFGAFEIAIFIIAKRKGFVDVPAIVSGVLTAILGAYLIIKPETMLNLFNIIFGVIILIIGVDHIFQSLFIIRYIRNLWWISLIVGVAAVVLGIITLLNPFSASRAIMILVGISMVIEAIGGFWNLPALKARPSADTIDVTPSNNSNDEDINA